MLRRVGVAVALAVAGLAVATASALPNSGWLGGTGGSDDTAAVAADRQSSDRADRSGVDRSGGGTQGKAPVAGKSNSASANKNDPHRWVYPISNYKVTSCYGRRWGRMHQGVDLAAKNGTPIVAAHGGTVVRTGDSGDGYGRKVVIFHGNNTYTLYGHSQKVLVHKGQKVVAGQRIALEGSTGHSTGPHLHFEVQQGFGHRINPVPYMRDRGIDLDFGGRCSGGTQGKAPVAGKPNSASANKNDPHRWVYPISNYKVTSCYGRRWGRMHQGVDLAAKNGTPIVAAHSGTVVKTGDSGDGYGRKVVIFHGDNTYTLYGHSQKVLVHKGQKVVAGQRIALEGSTGHATGPHLHFEVQRGLGHRVNPVPFMRDRGIDFGGRCG